MIGCERVVVDTSDLNDAVDEQWLPGAQGDGVETEVTRIQ